MSFDLGYFTKIDKDTYSKRIKLVFFSACALLMIIALTISTVLIQLLGSADGDNFWLNIAGVVIALASCLIIYNTVKSKPFFTDIVYVRSIKAQLNYIYRKQRKILEAAEQGDTTAMAILNFSYSASDCIYKLDNNTLTLEELAKSEQQLALWADKYDVTDFIEYEQDLLKQY